MGSIEPLLRRLTLRQIRLVASLAGEGSILRASRAIGISQPAATKLLADLEDNTGGPLFVRSNRGVLPNQRGEVLVRYVRLALLQLANGLQELVDLDDGNAGEVIVGNSMTASDTLLPRAIARLRRTRPGVSMAVVEGAATDLFPRLSLGHFDLVVGRLPEFSLSSDLKYELLYRESVNILVGAASDFARRPGLSLRDLVGGPWVLPPPESSVRRALVRALAGEGLRLSEVAVQSTSLAMTRRLLMEADMIGILPTPTVEEDLRAGRLIALPFSLPAAPVGVVWCHDLPLRPAALGLLDALRSGTAPSAETLGQ